MSSSRTRNGPRYHRARNALGRSRVDEPSNPPIDCSSRIGTTGRRKQDERWSPLQGKELGEEAQDDEAAGGRRTLPYEGEEEKRDHVTMGQG